MKPMTMQQRLLAVIRGEPHDRVPFVQYDSLLPNDDVRALLGRDNVGIIRWCGASHTVHEHCRFEDAPIDRDGRKGVRTTMHTPKGSLTCEKFFEPVYHSAATSKHYVSEIADYDILDSFLEDCRIVFDPTSYQRAMKELGEDGLPMLAIARTAWQQLWVQWVSLENLSWHFAEHEDRLMKTVELLNRQARQLFDCAGRVCPPFVDIPDNITAPAIGPDKFKRFCLPLYQDLAGRLGESGGLAFCHMDGNLKPLWDLIGQSGLRGIDSLSPPPDNDTSVGQAHALWPEMRLFMNYPSSVHLMAAGEVRRHTREILEQAGNTGRLSIQLSENVPPAVWRTSLPAIVKEITEFGTPACWR